MRKKKPEDETGAPGTEALISGLKERIRELEKNLEEIKNKEPGEDREKNTGMVHNVTGSQRTENALRVSEARLKRAELASKSGNWEFHLASGVIIGSEGALKLYGVDDFLTDYSIIKEIPLPEYRQMMDEKLKELIEHNKPYNIEFKIRNHKTGEIIDIHSISEYDSENKILFGSIQDITAYKRIEEKLKTESHNLVIAKEKAEESDRLKTAFLHNISHEIRTPLNAIIGFSGFLDQPDLVPEDRKNYINIIFQSNNQLLSIINDIINISQIETGQVVLRETQANLNKIMKNLYNQFYSEAEKKNLSFKLTREDSEDEIMIITDESKLIQILTNLLNNAIKFTEKGFVEMGYKILGDHLEFFVKDTGIGIPEKEHSRIFERFYQVEKSVSRLYGGTGLGLSISNAYVKLLGGNLKFISVSGEGSLFFFTIPYRKSVLKPENDGIFNQAVKPVKKTNKTILIAEDEESNFQLIKALLKSYNYDLIRSINGQDTIDIIKANTVVDMILMDIKMPLKDGFEATSEILKYRPEIPIIAQTAYAHATDRTKALQCGCVDYIAKPFERKQLLALIEKYLK